MTIKVRPKVLTVDILRNLLDEFAAGSISILDVWSEIDELTLGARRVSSLPFRDWVSESEIESGI